MKKIWYLLILAAVILQACSSPTETQSPGTKVEGKKIDTPGGTYTNITAAELQTMLDQKDFLLVNVHIPFEGDIPNTDISIPYDVIDQHLAELPEDKNARIVLYCRSDRMSTIASEVLVDLGYTNIWNLEGGMADWEQAGFEIEGR